MTDRIRTLTVILDGDYRDDEYGADRVCEALKMVKGVADVHKGEPVGHDDYAARQEYAKNVGEIVSVLASANSYRFGAEKERDFYNKVKELYEGMKQ